MGFIEKFNKQATITKLNKTPLYKEIEEHKNLLSDHKIDFKIKQEMDLFLYEVIYRSFYNEWRINRAWDEFRGEYYDTFNYINYEETLFPVHPLHTYLLFGILRKRFQ